MTDRTPLPFALDIPFVQALGMQLWRFDSGIAEISLDVRPEMQNSWQVAHGGVVMTLLDVVMAHAARSVRDAGEHGTPGIVTLEMKTSFMRPATGRLVAWGHLLHGTKGTAFCEGSVRDAGGALCAHATGTFKFLRKLKRGDELDAAS
ncbi:MAG TPA: PaaI family thioesterase [Burkholderiaceae bacterium]